MCFNSGYDLSRAKVVVTKSKDIPIIQVNDEDIVSLEEDVKEKMEGIEFCFRLSYIIDFSNYMFYTVFVH